MPSTLISLMNAAGFRITGEYVYTHTGVVGKWIIQPGETPTQTVARYVRLDWTLHGWLDELAKE